MHTQFHCIWRKAKFALIFFHFSFRQKNDFISIEIPKYVVSALKVEYSFNCTLFVVYTSHVKKTSIYLLFKHGLSIRLIISTKEVYFFQVQTYAKSLFRRAYIKEMYVNGNTLHFIIFCSNTICRKWHVQEINNVLDEKYLML